MPVGKIKMGKGGKDKDKLKDKARKIISNPKKLGGREISNLPGIKDPNRDKLKGAGPKRTNSNKAFKTLIDMILPGTPRSVKANTMRQFEAARNSLKAPVKRGR